MAKPCLSCFSLTSGDRGGGGGGGGGGCVHSGSDCGGNDVGSVAVVAGMLIVALKTILITSGGQWSWCWWRWWFCWWWWFWF